MNDILISSLKTESAILRSTLRETVAELEAAKEMLAARIVERDELKEKQAITAGALTIAELECVRLRSELAVFKEGMPHRIHLLEISNYIAGPNETAEHWLKVGEWLRRIASMRDGE